MNAMIIKRSKPGAGGAARKVAAWVLAWFLCCEASQALAQGKKNGKPAPARQAAPSEASPRGAKGAGRKASGGRDVVMEDGRKVKAYSFGTVDLEGKLKTPQLLYFLNRVRVELDSTTQQRRSFIPELKQTAVEKGL